TAVRTWVDAHRIRGRLVFGAGTGDVEGDLLEDEATADPVGVDPGAHGGEILRADEDGQGHGAKHPLDRAGPAGLTGIDLDEFGCEGQSLLAQSGAGGELGPDRHEAVRHGRSRT